MKLSEFVQMLEHLAASMPDCDDPEVGLYDRDREVTLVVDPDGDRFEFEVTRGDAEILIEF